MTIKEIEKKLGGNLWIKEDLCRIYFNMGRRDLKVWLELDLPESIEDEYFTFEKCGVKYRFSTENVSEKWMTSQWRKYAPTFLVKLEQFKCLQKNWLEAFNLLNLVLEQGLEEEFFNVVDEFAHLSNNTNNEQDLSNFLLEHLTIEDDEKEEKD